MVVLAEEWLKFEEAIGSRPQLIGQNIHELKQNAAKMAPPPVGAQSTEKLHIYDTKIDGTEFEIRVYVPKAGGRASAVGLFFHGGGWCSGSIDGEDSLAQLMADGISIPFVSVGYRLAPENPWPASLDDCVAAAQWAVHSLPKTGATVESPKIILTGTSAGGQLAFATAAKLLESGQAVHGIAAMAPVTVMEQMVPAGSRANYTSRVENSDTPMVSPGTLQIFLDANGHDPRDTSFNVLLSPSIGKFPPSYLAICGSDILRDDSLLMVEELKKNGIRVKYDMYDGYPHMFWMIPTLDAAKAFNTNLIEGLKFILSE